MVLSVSLRPTIISIVLLLVCAGTLLFADSRTGGAAAPVERVRVAVVSGAPAVTVSGEGVLLLRDGEPPAALDRELTVRSFNDVMLVNGGVSRRLICIGAPYVLLGGRPYRGQVELLPGDKGVLAVNELPLEEYLAGLINSEISSSWPLEAVKAQAVIARTYALSRRDARRNAPYHLESSVIDQVYEGSAREDSRSRRAVEETAGQVLTYNGGLAQALYHSNCGGRTESAESVWGSPIPYLKGVECRFCLNVPSAVWEQRLALKEIEERLAAAGHRVSGLTGLRGSGITGSGRFKTVVLSMERGELSLSGDQFRKAIGYGVIKSTSFTVRVADGEAFFSGSGNGHGVGLCQWGARQRAQDGLTYREILAYYYPGTALMERGGAQTSRAGS